MRLRLINVAIAKHTLAKRHLVRDWLYGLRKDALMPKERAPQDALRRAASYVGSARAASPHALKALGRDHLFDSDVRVLAAALLGGAIDPLWRGVWLCLGEAKALKDVRALAALVCAGSVRVSTLTLEPSQANRRVLAEELAHAYLGQLTSLTRRLGLAKPNRERIEAEYMQLCSRIRNAEHMLGVQVPCLSEQVTFAEALARAPA